MTPIAQVRWRHVVRVKGQVRSVQVAPQRDVPTFEVVVDDGTGTLLAVFLGRRELAGVQVGTRIEVTGTVGVHKTRLAILNPSYAIAGPPETDPSLPRGSADRGERRGQVAWNVA